MVTSSGCGCSDACVNPSDIDKTVDPDNDHGEDFEDDWNDEEDNVLNAYFVEFSDVSHLFCDHFVFCHQDH